MSFCKCNWFNIDWSMECFHSDWTPSQNFLISWFYVFENGQWNVVLVFERLTKRSAITDPGEHSFQDQIFFNFMIVFRKYQISIGLSPPTRLGVGAPFYKKSWMRSFLWSTIVEQSKIQRTSETQVEYLTRILVIMWWKWVINFFIELK